MMKWSNIAKVLDREKEIMMEAIFKENLSNS